MVVSEVVLMVLESLLSSSSTNSQILLQYNVSIKVDLHDDGEYLYFEYHRKTLWSLHRC